MSTMFPTYNEAHDALLARVRANLPALEALQQEMTEAKCRRLKELALLESPCCCGRVWGVRSRSQSQR